MHRRLVWLSLAALLVATLFLNLSHWRAAATGTPAPVSALHRLAGMQRPSDRPAPAPAIESYVRLQFARQMRVLRPAILDAARRHNRPKLSNMNDREFAVAITIILYMAVEYLAANLERGLYRTRFEGVPVTWRALAAWHNQGIVSPEDIRQNLVARDYVRRTSAYLASAYALIDTPDCNDTRCKSRSKNKL
ncbi:MAG: hypothetical protein ACJ8CR_31710 [Roseiflexaceae bacterium]